MPLFERPTPSAGRPRVPRRRARREHRAAIDRPVEPTATRRDGSAAKRKSSGALNGSSHLLEMRDEGWSPTTAAFAIPSLIDTTYADGPPYALSSGGQYPRNRVALGSLGEPRNVPLEHSRAVERGFCR